MEQGVLQGIGALFGGAVEEAEVGDGALEGGAEGVDALSVGELLLAQAVAVGGCVVGDVVGVVYNLVEGVDLEREGIGEEGVGEGGGLGEGAGGLGVAKGVEGGEARWQRCNVGGEAVEELGAAVVLLRQCVVWGDLRLVAEVDGGGELGVAAEGAALADLRAGFSV